MKRSKVDSPAQVEEELAPIIPIRTETILSQYPLHRLAKRSTLQIQVTKVDPRGRVISTWEVSPSKKYGEPGPLSYKLDTLLVNRAIDEARPHIPEVIRLGSLRDICAALGLAADTNLVKKALLQNASAFITARLDYRGSDGMEKTFEFGATRYEVIFIGQRLPSGKRADAVYVILHRTFREFLEHAKTRPLDYEYLKALTPAAQRLYELISFQVFAALKNGNARARYLYSDFCKYAPLTRYLTWERVKKQLYKIHKPHKDSGYIAEVEFEETTDEEGQPDWVMWYTPGPKAKREFEEFRTKRFDRAPTRPSLVPHPEDAEDASLIGRLIAEGITESTARGLLRDCPDEVVRQLEAFPFRERVKDRAAYLVKAIRDRYALPADLEERKARARKQRETERVRAEERARKEHREKHALKYFDYLRGEMKALEEKRPTVLAEFYAHFGDFDGVSRRLGPEGKEALMLSEFGEWVGCRPELHIFTFWDWDKYLNPERFRAQDEVH
jgi:hypothetical protein